MKFLTVFFCILFMPEVAIGQVNRTKGDQVSNLGNMAAKSDREARQICRREKGGNVVVRHRDKRYSCHYAQQLAK